MTRLNKFLWTSQERNGIGNGVGAERLREGISIRVTNSATYMGFNLTSDQALDLAEFIQESVAAEKLADAEGATS